MAITLADLPPEFASVDADTASMWIDAAYAEIDTKRWVCAGVNPDTGAKMLAAHYLKTSGNGTDAKIAKTQIAARSIGGTSTTLALGSAASGPNGSTPYGRSFDAMLSRVHRARRTHLPPTPKP